MYIKITPPPPKKQLKFEQKVIFKEQYKDLNQRMMNNPKLIYYACYKNNLYLAYIFRRLGSDRPF